MGTCVRAGGALSRACPHLPGLHRRGDPELRRERGSLLGCCGGTGTADRGNRACRVSEARTHLACSSENNWLEMAGEWGVRGAEQR